MRRGILTLALLLVMVIVLRVTAFAVVLDQAVTFAPAIKETTAKADATLTAVYGVPAGEELRAANACTFGIDVLNNSGAARASTYTVVMLTTEAEQTARIVDEFVAATEMLAANGADFEAVEVAECRIESTMPTFRGINDVAETSRIRTHRRVRNAATATTGYPNPFFARPMTDILRV